jgi:hypothetical protein
MRRTPRTDANQAAIVSALRAVGASVQVLAAVGGGCPDLLVGHRGVNYVVEVKDGRKPLSARRLTPAQERWHREWRGRACVVASVEQALAAIGIPAGTGRTISRRT